MVKNWRRNRSGFSWSHKHCFRHSLHFCSLEVIPAHPVALSCGFLVCLHITHDQGSHSFFFFFFLPALARTTPGGEGDLQVTSQSIPTLFFGKPKCKKQHAITHDKQPAHSRPKDLKSLRTCSRILENAQNFYILVWLGRVKKIGCLSSPIFLPDRDFFFFFILTKTGIHEGRHTILVHSIEMSKKVVEKESHKFHWALFPVRLLAHCMHMGAKHVAVDLQYRTSFLLPLSPHNSGARSQKNTGKKFSNFPWALFLARSVACIHV